ncbi:phasin family protein [Syntrophomonas palmitatica]|uniref:phasin family protein n=1 Tax=Syntrophomonas palmitatica TaxID=402877 RepID=UPI0006CFE85A|nr:hypothetical protein [Syntrophomonas palmitatica]
MRMFRDAFYFGLGALGMTRERVEKYYNEMIEKGEVTKEEARQFIEDAIKRGEEERKEMRNMVREEMDDLHKEFFLVRRKEFEALEARVKELEDKMRQQG